MRRHGTGAVDSPATDGQADPGSAPAVVHTRASVHDVAQPVKVYSSGVLVGQRAILDFIGAAVADVSASGKVTITISTSAPYTSQPMKCYPTAAAGVSLDSTTSAWAPGSWTQIVPPNTLTNAIVVVGVITKPAGAVGEVQLGVGSSPASADIATVPFADISMDGLRMLAVPVAVAANAEIRGRLGTSGTTLRTYSETKILYYERPL